jgi:hypothetical protein
LFCGRSNAKHTMDNSPWTAQGLSSFKKWLQTRASNEELLNVQMATVLEIQDRLRPPLPEQREGFAYAVQMSFDRMALILEELRRRNPPHF